MVESLTNTFEPGGDFVRIAKSLKYPLSLKVRNAKGRGYRSAATCAPWCRRLSG